MVTGTPARQKRYHILPFAWIILIVIGHTCKAGACAPDKTGSHDTQTVHGVLPLERDDINLARIGLRLQI
jgi:hypothetical protein